MKKISLLIAAAVGYVLGTRAGRERYEQMKTQAQKVWGSPTVQSTVDDAGQFTKQAASDLGDKAGNLADQAKHYAGDKMPGSLGSKSDGSDKNEERDTGGADLPRVPGSPAATTSPEK